MFHKSSFQDLVSKMPALGPEIFRTATQFSLQGNPYATDDKDNADPRPITSFWGTFINYEAMPEAKQAEGEDSEGENPEDEKVLEQHPFQPPNPQALNNPEKLIDDSTAHRFWEATPIVLYRVFEGVGWTLGLASLTAQVFALAAGIAASTVVAFCITVGAIALIYSFANLVYSIKQIHYLESKVNLVEQLFETVMEQNQNFARTQRIPPDSLLQLGHDATLINFNLRRKQNKFVDKRPTWLWLWGGCKTIFARLKSVIGGFGLSLGILTFFMPLVLATPTGLPFAAIYTISGLIGLLAMMTEIIISHDMSRKSEHLHHILSHQLEQLQNSLLVNAAYKTYYELSKIPGSAPNKALRRTASIINFPDVPPRPIHRSRSPLALLADAKQGDAFVPSANAIQILFENESPYLKGDPTEKDPQPVFVIPVMMPKGLSAEDIAGIEAKVQKLDQKEFHHYYLQGMLVGFYRFLNGIGWTIGVTTLVTQVFTAFIPFGLSVNVVLAICFFVGVYHLIKSFNDVWHSTTKVTHLIRKREFFLELSKATKSINERLAATIRDNIATLGRSDPIKAAGCQTKFEEKFARIAKVHQANEQECQLPNNPFGWPKFLLKKTLKFSKMAKSFIAGFGLSFSVLAFFVPLIVLNPITISLFTICLFSAWVGVLSVIVEHWIEKVYRDILETLQRELTLAQANAGTDRIANVEVQVIEEYVREAIRLAPRQVQAQAQIDEEDSSDLSDPLAVSANALVHGAGLYSPRGSQGNRLMVVDKLALPPEPAETSLEQDSSSRASTPHSLAHA